jgi:hypothetical protein
MALAPCRIYSSAADRPTLACPGAGQVEVTSDAIAERRYDGAPGPPAVAGTDVIVLPPDPIGSAGFGPRAGQCLRSHWPGKDRPSEAKRR